MSFAVGDKVRVTSDACAPALPVGAEGTVTGMEDETHIYVNTPEYPTDALVEKTFGGPVGWALYDHEVELIAEVTA